MAPAFLPGVGLVAETPCRFERGTPESAASGMRNAARGGAPMALLVRVLRAHDMTFQLDSASDPKRVRAR